MIRNQVCLDLLSYKVDFTGIKLLQPDNFRSIHKPVLSLTNPNVKFFIGYAHIHKYDKSNGKVECFFNKGTHFVDQCIFE